MDIQICKFLVGSFNYDNSSLTFNSMYTDDANTAVKSIIDYDIHIYELPRQENHYVSLGMNYSVAGFEMVLTRKISYYFISYYLPSSLFVLVSWISFLINPEEIPGRMTLLIIILLVLINTFNTIQSKSPIVDGITAIESWVMACIYFVLAALCEYAVILFLIRRRLFSPVHEEEKDVPNLFPLHNINSTRQSMSGETSNLDRPVEHENSEGNNGTDKDHNLHVSNPFVSDPLNEKKGGKATKDRYAQIDLIFLVVFPIMFIIFNIFYWSSLYMSRDTNNNFN